MRLIFSVDALAPHLTGIGRYTWELAVRLRRHPGFRQLRFYRAGHWVGDIDALRLEPTTTGQPARRARAGTLQKKLTGLYWHTTCRFNVFHAPNYFLPDYARNGVVSVHDLSVMKYPESHPRERVASFEKQFRGTLDRARHLVTDTEAVRQELMDEFGWPAERVTAVPLGVLPSYHPRPPTDLQATLATHGLVTGGYTLCVSTLEPRKRLGALLSAYGLLPAALRQLHPLVLVGPDGWKSSELRVRIEQAQEAGWARYLGFVSEETLPLLYAGAALFAYPSVYEGFGLPVAEALASGVPVVTSDRSCLPEVSGGAALLVDADDADALRDALERGLCDAGWRSTARLRGLEVARAYTWDACAAATIEVYRRVASEGLA